MLCFGKVLFEGTLLYLFFQFLAVCLFKAGVHEIIG